MKRRLGKIAMILKEAGQRAQRWINQHQTPTPCTLALDEQDSSQRGKASLNGMDVQSGHLWATLPPVEVDGESWTLVLWYVQEQGISHVGTVSDGGRAIQKAVSQVQGAETHQRDVWHLFLAHRLISAQVVPSLICAPNRSLRTSPARARGSNGCWTTDTAIAPTRAPYGGSRTS
jgi:hypothetical protein